MSFQSEVTKQLARLKRKIANKESARLSRERKVIQSQTLQNALEQANINMAKLFAENQQLKKTNQELLLQLGAAKDKQPPTNKQAPEAFPKFDAILPDFPCEAAQLWPDITVDDIKQ